ncbi:MAG: hypothetical protein GX086_03210 [Alcaligenaceae bacterium]|nr:hypothetical protein [Alcaligenaceae bacterium]
MNQIPASPEPPRSGLARTAQTAAGTCAAIARYGDTTPFLKIPMAPIALFIALCAAISALIFLMQALRFWQHTITGTPSTAQKGQTS